MRLTGLLSWFGKDDDIAAVPPMHRAEAVSYSVSEWFGRHMQHSDSVERAMAAPQSEWTPARLKLADALWGEGFLLPGGMHEVLHLTRPLGLSTASSLLLIGAGSGGAACCIAARSGSWVTGFESESDLIAAASECCIKAGLGRRAQIEGWDPDAPTFGHRTFHHGLALEPLRRGMVEPVLNAIAAALKSSGQLVLMDLVAGEALEPDDPDLLRWARLEQRLTPLPPTEVAITRILGRLGVDVRIAEDISHRHAQQALASWRRLGEALRLDPPSPRAGAVLVRDAEMWLMRLRLIRANKLRVVRWHGISPALPRG